MKKRRLLSIIYMVTVLLCLSGCSGGGLNTDRSEIERLMLIQTMGLDRKGDGIEMSVSSGLGIDDSPALVMTAAATGMEAAIARLQNYSPENQLYYGHVQYLLLGQQAAVTDLASILEWVDRSPVMRMGTTMFIVRGSAVEAVEATSLQSTDITERLSALERGLRVKGQQIYSLREVASALSDGRGALCLAVETASSEDTVLTEDKQADAVIPAGYAVLNGGGLVDFLTPEQSLGAQILTASPTGTLVSVDENTLELLSCDTDISGRWDSRGKLTGITVECTLRAGLLESALDRQTDPDRLDEAFSRDARGWLTDVLSRSQALSCDFLGLKTAVLDRGKDRAALAEQWSDVFPSLPVTVTVDGRVDRNYDLSD